MDKLGGEQLILASEEETEELVAGSPVVEKKAAARRNGQEWTEPFKSTDAHLMLPLPEAVAGPKNGHYITPR